jgi:hypothetical protein
MTAKDHLTKLLRIVVTTIESLEPDQIDKLVTGRAKLAFVAPGSSKGTTNLPLPDQADLIERLDKCTDRNQARQILSVLPSRDTVAVLARALKIHIVKHDRREDIESKIVEFVIGGKLRTEAIRSLNLKGSARSVRD